VVLAAVGLAAVAVIAVALAAGRVAPVPWALAALVAEYGAALRSGGGVDAAAGEAAEIAGRQRRRDAGTQSLLAHGRLGGGSARRQLEIEQQDQRGHRQRQQPYRHRDPGNAHTAGLSCRHLAVVIEPSEGQHDAQQQSDRQENGHVLGRAKPDQFQHEAALVLQLRRARQHRAHLVDEQDGEQHYRHAQEVDGHFPEDIALQNSQQALI